MITNGEANVNKLYFGDKELRMALYNKKILYAKNDIGTVIPYKQKFGVEVIFKSKKFNYYNASYTLLVYDGDKEIKRSGLVYGSRDEGDGWNTYCDDDLVFTLEYDFTDEADPFVSLNNYSKEITFIIQHYNSYSGEYFTDYKYTYTITIDDLSKILNKKLRSITLYYDNSKYGQDLDISKATYYMSDYAIILLNNKYENNFLYSLGLCNESGKEFVAQSTRYEDRVYPFYGKSLYNSFYQQTVVHPNLLTPFYKDAPQFPIIYKIYGLYESNSNNGYVNIYWFKTPTIVEFNEVQELKIFYNEIDTENPQRQYVGTGENFYKNLQKLTEEYASSLELSN